MTTTYRGELDDIVASRGQAPERQRLHRLFDVTWRHLMHERPDAATFLGWPEGGDRLPDLHSTPSSDAETRPVNPCGSWPPSTPRPSTAPTA